MDYVIQCKHNMLVTGNIYCILGIAKGFDLERDVVYYLIALDKEDRKVIPLVCKNFMEKHVFPKVPPTEVLGPYVSEFKKSLMKYYAKTAVNRGDTLKIPTTMISVLEDLLAKREHIASLRKQIAQIEKEVDRLEDPLIAMLEDKYQYGELETMYRTVKIGYSVSKTPTMLADNLKRLHSEKPELYRQLSKEGYITSREDRRFTVKEKQKKRMKSKRTGAVSYE